MSGARTGAVTPPELMIGLQFSAYLDRESRRRCATAAPDRKSDALFIVYLTSAILLVRVCVCFGRKKSGICHRGVDILREGK